MGWNSFDFSLPFAASEHSCRAHFQLHNLSHLQGPMVWRNQGWGLMVEGWYTARTTRNPQVCLGG